jgi:hypothetical protein
MPWSGLVHRLFQKEESGRIESFSDGIVRHSWFLVEHQRSGGDWNIALSCDLYHRDTFFPDMDNLSYKDTCNVGFIITSFFY